jgi:hypothetical protein
MFFHISIQFARLFKFSKNLYNLYEKKNTCNLKCFSLPSKVFFKLFARETIYRLAPHIHT